MNENAKNFIEYLELSRVNRRLAHLEELIAWECLKRLAKYLDQKEYEVLKMRFHESKTLEEVGKTLGITRERIRQIEARAMEKIRQLSIKNE